MKKVALVILTIALALYVYAIGFRIGYDMHAPKPGEQLLCDYVSGCVVIIKPQPIQKSLDK